jgi:hypothetical protein
MPENTPARPIPDPGRAVQSPGAPELLAAHSAALQWLDLSAGRSREVAAELARFDAAAAAVRGRLRFDSEPSDWEVTFARWHREAR